MTTPIAAPALIHAAEATKGMYLVHTDGQRWQVVKATTEGNVTRLRIRNADGATRSISWRPTAVLTMHADQGTCADCQLPLVPGAKDDDGDETANFRSVGFDQRLRYFCPAGDDGLHHPVVAR